jgi:hypothetical protein
MFDENAKQRVEDNYARCFYTGSILTSLVQRLHVSTRPADIMYLASTTI